MRRQGGAASLLRLCDKGKSGCCPGHWFFLMKAALTMLWSKGPPGCAQVTSAVSSQGQLNSCTAQQLALWYRAPMASFADFHGVIVLTVVRFESPITR